LETMARFLEHSKRLAQSKQEQIQNIKRSIESDEQDKKSAKDRLDRLHNQRRELANNKQQITNRIVSERQDVAVVERALQEGEQEN